MIMELGTVIHDYVASILFSRASWLREKKPVQFKINLVCCKESTKKIMQADTLPLGTEVNNSVFVVKLPVTVFFLHV